MFVFCPKKRSLFCPNFCLKKLYFAQSGCPKICILLKVIIKKFVFCPKKKLSLGKIQLRKKFGQKTNRWKKFGQNTMYPFMLRKLYFWTLSLVRQDLYNQYYSQYFCPYFPRHSRIIFDFLLKLKKSRLATFWRWPMQLKSSLPMVCVLLWPIRVILSKMPTLSKKLQIWPFWDYTIG